MARYFIRIADKSGYLRHRFIIRQFFIKIPAIYKILPNLQKLMLRTGSFSDQSRRV
ncbi:MAG: hypothetical protein AAB469_01705 [Patescibacteria group bacterium]